jgi:hypothetical protein
MTKEEIRKTVRAMNGQIGASSSLAREAHANGQFTPLLVVAAQNLTALLGEIAAQLAEANELKRLNEWTPPVGGA